MNSWFIRHAKGLGVEDKDVQGLWDEDRIAVHFPGIGAEDSVSTDPNDYRLEKHIKGIRAIVDLAKEGGYVWADYRTCEEAKVGWVQPSSTIEIKDGTWRQESKYPGRKAKLKTLRITKVQIIPVGAWMSLRVARPRKGTISLWAKAYAKLDSIMNGTVLPRTWDNLSSAVQEIVCSEYLRSPQNGLPKLRRLLVPVGRTMKDVDIYGLAEDGKKLFAQVTFHEKPATYRKKKKRLELYRDGDAHLIMFCQCANRTFEDNIQYVPVETDVLNWLNADQAYATVCFLNV